MTGIFLGADPLTLPDGWQVFVGATKVWPTSTFTAATLDPTRKGVNAALSNGNLTATFSDASIAATQNVLEASTAAYYWECRDDVRPAYLAGGLLPAGDPIFSWDTWLGAYSGASWWNDGSVYAQDGITKNGSGPSVDEHATRRFALIAGKLYVGIVGRGWWNPASSDWTGDPATGVGALFEGFTGNWSPAISCDDAAGNTMTCNFGGSAFGSAPPAGCTGWPAP